jgi:hypothetical protein
MDSRHVFEPLISVWRSRPPVSVPQRSPERLMDAFVGPAARPDTEFQLEARLKICARAGISEQALDCYRVPLPIFRQIGVERRRNEADERPPRLADVNPTVVALDDTHPAQLVDGCKLVGKTN